MQEKAGDTHQAEEWQGLEKALLSTYLLRGAWTYISHTEHLYL